jgi:ParB family chromosome partitioning protein
MALNQFFLFFVMPFESNSIFWVEVDKISPNPFQPRRDFDESRLRELADSIRMYGVMQPLTVTRKEMPKDDGGLMVEYELIAGERRLRASKLAGLAQVPVIIRSSEESDRMKLELAIIENLQREDLNPVDRALAFKQLAEQFQLSHSQVAKKVGRSREYVSNTLRLLQLPEDIITSMKRGEITEGHGRALLMLASRPEEQKTLFREIILKKLSVREVERISRKIASDRVRKKEWANIDPELIEIEKQFTSTLGTRVQISRTDFGGKLTIDYFSQEDLRKILDVIAEGKQHVPDAHFAMPDIPKDSMAPGPLDGSPVSGGISSIEPVESVDALVAETVQDVPDTESVDAPMDDRTQTEQIEVEKKDMADDPDLYAIRNFVV